MIIHYIAEAILTFLLINLSYRHVKMVRAANSLVEMNQMFISEYEIVYAKIVELEEELKLTQQTRDLYWGDRNSLMENIKSMRGFNDQQNNM